MDALTLSTIPGYPGNAKLALELTPSLDTLLAVRLYRVLFRETIYQADSMTLCIGSIIHSQYPFDSLLEHNALMCSSCAS